MTRRASRPLLQGALPVLLVLAGVPVARAEPGQTTWTTYLYTGPGMRYPVADEVLQGQAVQVLGCADGWCRISFDQRSGYVEADVVVRGTENAANPPPGILAQPAAAMTPSPKGPCLLVEQTSGNGGKAMTYVCQK